jgi:hypothetical protein
MPAELHVLRLDLPGLWSDGWLYKEHLVLWTRDGHMFTVPLSELTRAVREYESAPLETIADVLIFRNDWKTGELFQRLLQVPGIEESFVRQFSKNAEIVLSVASATPELVPGSPIPGVILDSALYANHVYLASTQGLFETRFDPDSPTRQNPIVSRLGRRVSAVTAGFAAVNGSAGEEGLWFGSMDFDERPWWDGKNVFRQVADLSRGNSFADVNLLNYTDEAFPGFLRSETVKEQVRSSSDRDERRITDYNTQADIGGLISSVLGGSRKSRRDLSELPLDDNHESPVVLGNSGQRLLMASGDSLRVVDLSLKRHRDLAVKQDHDFRDLSDLDIDPYAILDTHAFGRGFLVELSDEVRLISAQGSFTLISEPVARIRTFARSRRYREVVLLIRETGVSLLGFYIPQVLAGSA